MERRSQAGKPAVKSPASQRGFTYIGLLMAVTVMGLMLTVVGRVWSTVERRERETQLLFAGHQYRSAIGAYFAHRHQYPGSLQDLLGDADSAPAQRYLRRLYPDPVSGSPEWQLIAAPAGGIMGVASTSNREPVKKANFSVPDASFADSDCYCGWKFVYEPRYSRRQVQAK
jgi:type II secretory pathway pseudopilin PulG